ncbi:MAG: hypothetical protein ACKOAR_03985 [Bacteroidota bacterium]
MKHLALLVFLLVSACRSTQTAGDNAVPFTIATHYFVNNTAGSPVDSVITDASRFNELFGMATTMGPDGKPTPIDFSTQFVIAIVRPVTALSTTLEAAGLQRENGNLVLDYKLTEGAQQSFTTRPLLMVIVDRSNLAPVILKQQ